MPSDGQPDWGKIARNFDIWLPQLQSVNDVLIQVLDVQKGDNVLDVACGTGEPAISIARQHPDARVIATDAAQAMVGVVQEKIQDLDLKNIQAKYQTAEQLDFAAESFDKLVCRFGVMLFEDPLRGLKQMAKMLKPKGVFAFTVWSLPESMPNLHWSYLVFKDRLPKELHPPMYKATCLSDTANFTQILKQAGFHHVNIETKQVNYEFRDFDHYWQIMVDSQIIERQLQALDGTARQEVREEMGNLAAGHQSDRGLIIPHEYLLAYGLR